MPSLTAPIEGKGVSGGMDAAPLSAAATGLLRLPLACSYGESPRRVHALCGQLVSRYHKGFAVGESSGASTL